MKVQFHKDRSVSQDTDFLCNQFESESSEILINIVSDFADLSYFYYLICKSPNDVVDEFAVPLLVEVDGLGASLNRIRYIVGNNVSKYIGDWQMCVVIKDSEMVDGVVGVTGLVAVSEDFTCKVKSGIIQADPLAEQTLDPNLQIIYDDLLALTASIRPHLEDIEALADELQVFADSASASATTASTALSEITAMHSDITAINDLLTQFNLDYASFNTSKDSFDTDYADFITKYGDLVTKYSDFITKYSDFATKYSDFAIKYDVVVADKESIDATKILIDAMYADIIGNYDTSLLIPRIEEIESQLSEPDYTPELFRQEPIFSTGSGYVGTTLTDLSADIIQGQVPINVKGLSVASFIDNGNFVSMDGWINYLSNVAVLNNEVTFTATGTGGRISQGFKAELDNVYYMFCDVKADSSSVKFRMAGFTSISHSGSGLYEHLSSYAKATVEYSSVFLVEDTRTSGWTAVKVKNAVGINLTAMFGVGNEPTKEQCDKMFPIYFDGIGSVKGVNVKSVGKNVFDGQLELGGIDASTGLNEVNVLRMRSKNFTNIKKATSYVLSQNKTYSWVINFYDSNYKFITYHVGTNFTTPSEACYLKIRTGLNNENDLSTLIQIEQGTTATPYEDYQESITYLPDLHSVPSGAKDEINGSKHTIKVMPYELKASDVESLYTTPTNVDIINLKVFSDFKTGIPQVDGYIFPNYPPKVFADSLNNENTSYNNGTGALRIVVPNATYTTLAEAQTALAGTKIQYELATPIVQDLDITPLTVYPNGTISIESDEETVMPELYMSYPLDMSAVVARLNDGVNQNSKAINFITANKVIEESGSNENGNYVRFADGTQICTKVSSTTLTTSTGSAFPYSSTVDPWTYPATFITKPAISATPIRSNGIVFAVNAGTILTTEANGFLLYGSTSSSAGVLTFIAIGRWK